MPYFEDFLHFLPILFWTLLIVNAILNAILHYFFVELSENVLAFKKL